MKVDTIFTTGNAGNLRTWNTTTVKVVFRLPIYLLAKNLLSSGLSTKKSIHTNHSYQNVSTNKTQKYK
jgi:hypothetical protein